MNLGLTLKKNRIEEILMRKALQEGNYKKPKNSPKVPVLRKKLMFWITNRSI